MTLPTLLTAAILACMALAQYNITSKPFHLLTLSHDAKYNGTYLYPCHAGAAIEVLCVGSSDRSEAAEYRFNTSSTPSNPPVNKAIGEQGYLTWLLRGTTFAVSEALSLYYSPTTNVALPLFVPGFEGTVLVAFDSAERLNIQGNVNDSVVPAEVGETKAFYRWWVCKTYYGGYRYTTLAWLMGEGPPQNPTCCKVEVEREFV